MIKAIAIRKRKSLALVSGKEVDSSPITTQPLPPPPASRFTVTDTRTVAGNGRKAFRPDLDELEQRAAIRQYRAQRGYDVNLRFFDDTSSSNENHLRFIDSMLAEAYHYHCTRLLSSLRRRSLPLLKAWRTYLHVLRRELHSVMEVPGDEDYYPECIQRLGQSTLYCDLAPARAHELISNAMRSYPDCTVEVALTRCMSGEC